MTNATITKTVKKAESRLNGSLLTEPMGFVRWFVLPVKVRKSLELSYILSGSNENFATKCINFFEDMSSEEYINYLKLA